MFSLKRQGVSDPAADLKAAVRVDDAANLDFLPDGYHERRARRRSNAICLVLFVIVLGVVAGTFHLTEKTLANVESEYRKVDEAFTTAARRIEQAQQMRAKQKTVADRAELTASLLEMLPRSNVLAEMTNALPAGVSLETLTLQSKEKKPAPVPQTALDKRKKKKAAAPALPKPTEYEVTLGVTGIGYTDLQIASYISALSRSDLFRRVDLKWIEQSKQAGETESAQRRFQIDLELEPTAEAAEHVDDDEEQVVVELPAGESMAAEATASIAN